MFVIFLVCLCGAAAAVFCAVKPLPWYPRLRNLVAPPALVGVILPPGLVFDGLVVEKSRRLLVAHAGGKPVKAYIVALSKRPVGHKQYEGDRRVPEGVYAIHDKNPFSRYHKNLGVSYPNQRDRAVAASLGKPPGGQIKVHGLGPRHAKRGTYHWLKDWTHGCIAVTDAEMDELYERTPVGVPIEIRE